MERAWVAYQEPRKSKTIWEWARCTLVFFMRDAISDLEASSLMSHSQLAVPLRILRELDKTEFDLYS